MILTNMNNKPDLKAPREVLSDLSKLRTAVTSLLDKEVAVKSSEAPKSERQAIINSARCKAIEDLLHGIDLVSDENAIESSGIQLGPDEIIKEVTDTFLEMLRDSEYAGANQYVVDNHDLVASVE